MLSRSIKVTFRVNSQEDEQLRKHVKKSGLSQESYLRTLIKGFVPKELPPLEYHNLIQELHAIGVNLNQIAVRSNATGHIDRAIFQYEANRLRRAVLDIQAAFTSPEKRCDDGGHGNLGRERPP